MEEFLFKNFVEVLTCFDAILITDLSCIIKATFFDCFNCYYFNIFKDYKLQKYRRFSLDQRQQTLRFALKFCELILSADSSDLF